MTKSFTDDERALLRRMIETEYASYSEAAAVLGVSRNSAISLGHRMGLQSSLSTGSDKRRRKKRLDTADAVPENGSVEHLSRMNTQRATLSRMGGKQTSPIPIRWENSDSPHAACWSCFQPNTMCHWPVRDEPFQFCGAPIACDSASYCAEHRRRSLRKYQGE